MIRVADYIVEKIAENCIGTLNVLFNS